MAILKLKNVGEEATLAIADVEVIPGASPKLGNQIKFETIGGDLLYVGENAVLRQLDRCGVAEIADLAGQIIHFSRAANKNAAFPPYWNLSKATESDIKKAANGNGKPIEAKRQEGVTQGKLPTDDPGAPHDKSDVEQETGAPPADATDVKIEQRAELLAAHGRCFAHVCNKYVPFAAEKGVELSLEGVSALTAQLWIEMNKRGLA